MTVFWAIFHAVDSMERRLVRHFRTNPEDMVMVAALEILFIASLIRFS